MADKTLNTRIVLRHDTAANWTQHNPTLLLGEAGYETDTQRLKFGDGVTAWTDLPYFGEAAESVANVYQAEVAAGADHQDAIAGAVDDAELHNGDIAIVKELISGDKRQYTAYVYNGSAWTAMDGNYDADSVYFDKDLIFTQAFGKFAPDSSGSVSIPTATNGLSLKSLLEQAFAEEKNPTITQPSTSVTLTGAGAKEVGTQFMPSYSVGFNKGKYQYGPDTGVTATAYAVTDTNSGSLATQTGSFDAFTVEDDTSYKVTVVTTHTEGAVPLTNLGNQYAAGKIAAGSKTATSSAVTGYRSMFAGAVTTPIALDSDGIRGLTGKKGQFAKTFSLTIPEGCKQVVVALPNSHTLTKVEDVGAFGTDIVGSFALQTAQVEGVGGYTAAEYNVYVYAPDAALGANTYNVTCA